MTLKKSRDSCGFSTNGRWTATDRRKVVHETIKSGLEQGKATSVEFEASTRPGDGYIHITDERAIPPAGRIGETEDLIGSVFVQEGKVSRDTE